MTSPHASSCALHNAPPSEPGQCDCGATDILERIDNEIDHHPASVKRLLAECAITIKALRTDRDEWQQCAAVEADLRREFQQAVIDHD